MELLKQSTKLICRAILFTLIFAVIILTGTRIISLTVAGRIICSTLRYQNILDYIQNETGEKVEFGDYWAGYVRAGNLIKNG